MEINRRKLLTSAVVTLASTKAKGNGDIQSDKNNDVISVKDFSAKGDGITDDTKSLQAFFDTLTTKGLIGFLNSGNYRITKKLIININTKSFFIIGTGSTSTTIFCDSGFTDDAVLWIRGNGVATSFDISGFSVKHTNDQNNISGIVMGDKNSVFISLLGYEFSKMSDIHSFNFKKSWDICHTRMVVFERCGAWNLQNKKDNIGLYISQNGAFTGDLVFDTCQFVSSAVSGSKCVFINSPKGFYDNSNGNNTICGIKFKSCDFYAGETCIHFEAREGSGIADIWFSAGCQKDQLSKKHSFLLLSYDNAFVENIHINDMYIGGGKLEGMQIVASSYIKHLYITNCYFLATEHAAINAYGSKCTGITVNNNLFLDCGSTDGAVQFNLANNITCCNNRTAKGIFNRVPNYLVTFYAGCSEIICTGNDGFTATNINTVKDDSGDVKKVINDNMGNINTAQSLTVTGSPFKYKNITGAMVAIAISGTITTMNIDGWGIDINIKMVTLGREKTLTVEYSGSLPNINIFYLTH